MLKNPEETIGKIIDKGASILLTNGLYVGLIFLIMLIVPDLLWTKNQPKDYKKYVGNENRVLLNLERIGEAAVVTCLIFPDFNVRPINSWSIFLLIAAILMILYELYWIRYFKSSKTMEDFYRSFLGVPVAGATLPVAAFGLLAVHGKNIFLGIAVIILGIGHIGIHLNHRKEVRGK